MRYLVILIFFISCTPQEKIAKIYPNFPIHKPGIEAKGELAISANLIATSGDTSSGVGWGTTIAYSPLKYLGLIGSMYHKKGKMNLGSNSRFLVGEIGLGAYYPIEFGRTRRANFLWEFYTGYNRGKGSDYQEYDNLGVSTGHENGFSYFDSKFHGYFFQLGFGVNYFNDRFFHFKIGGTLKIARLKYYDLQHVSNFQNVNLELPTFSTTTAGFDFKMGRNFFWVHFRLGLIFPSNSDTKEYFDIYSGNTLRVGVFTSLGIEKTFGGRSRRNKNQLKEPLLNQ